MDPYGFDVAVKKMKIENKYDSQSYSSWDSGIINITQSELSRNGMDLWPENMFETKFPYYTSDSHNLYTNSDEYTGSQQWFKPGQDKPEIDPERRKLSMGSGLLLSSHKKIKHHRSWWSCYLPHNLFVPHKLYNAIYDSNLDDFSNYYHHGYVHMNSMAIEDFDEWLTFSPKKDDVDFINEKLNSNDFKTIQFDIDTPDTPEIP